MRNFREKSINMLCELGKFGVGKSLTLGMYDFSIPDELNKSLEKDNSVINDKATSKKKNYL